MPHLDGTLIPAATGENMPTLRLEYDGEAVTIE